MPRSTITEIATDCQQHRPDERKRKDPKRSRGRTSRCGRQSATHLGAAADMDPTQRKLAAGLLAAQGVYGLSSAFKA